MQRRHTPPPLPLRAPHAVPNIWSRVTQQHMLVGASTIAPHALLLPRGTIPPSPLVTITPGTSEQGSSRLLPELWPSDDGRKPPASLPSAASFRPPRQSLTAKEVLCDCDGKLSWGLSHAPSSPSMRRDCHDALNLSRPNCRTCSGTLVSCSQTATAALSAAQRAGMSPVEPDLSEYCVAGHHRLQRLHADRVASGQPLTRCMFLLRGPGSHLIANDTACRRPSAPG